MPLRPLLGLAAHRLLLPLLLAACSKGDIEGEVKRPPTPPGQLPVPTHEHVAFTWESGDDSYSGRIQTTLPTGETFKGRFHELVTTVPVERYGEFYGAWYTGPFTDPGWYWGGAWPYFGSVDEFVTHYSGRVVARLTGDRGHEMRCHFTLADRYAGMKAGGKGECQVSSGERITAKFDAS